MIKLSEKGVFLASNNEIIAEEQKLKKKKPKKALLPGLFSLLIIRPEIWINLKLSLIH